MSVSLIQDSGRKRERYSVQHQETDENATVSFSKRVRSTNTFFSPQARCGDYFGVEGPSYHVNEATIKAVRALFPAMDENTFNSVIKECGSDIEQAIQRLTELQLAQQAHEEQAAAAATAAAVPHGHGHGGGAHGSSPAQPSPSGTGSPGEGYAGAGPSGSVTPAPAGPQPRTADQWVDLVVEEMSRAADMSDARARAGRVLRGFQEAVLYSQAEARSSELEPIRTKLSELVRDNAVLKRAVQIQGQKLQEGAERDRELEQLRRAVGGYQEQLRNLELSNYALATHLRQANYTQRQDHRGPDVF